VVKVFDYQCSACGHEEELWLKADEIPQCRKCGSTTMNKLPPATRGYVKEGPYDKYL